MDKMIERMRSIMRDKNIKAAELSRRTGIDRSNISHYLRGDYVPKADKVEKLAAALGVSVSYLAGFSDDPNFTEDPGLNSFLDTFTRMTQPGSFGPVRVSPDELRIIQAFRDADPVLQSAVLRLLNLEVNHAEK